MKPSLHRRSPWPRPVALALLALAAPAVAQLPAVDQPVLVPVTLRDPVDALRPAATNLVPVRMQPPPALTLPVAPAPRERETGATHGWAQRGRATLAPAASAPAPVPSMPEPDEDEEGRGLLDDARAAFARDAVPEPVRDPGPVRGWGWLAGTVSRLESAERQEVPMDDSSWDRALGRDDADDSRAERTDRREEPAYGVPARRGWGTESSRAAWRQQQDDDLQPGQRNDGAAPFGRPDDKR